MAARARRRDDDGITGGCPDARRRASVAPLWNTEPLPSTFPVDLPNSRRESLVESHSVLGTLWAGLGMGGYYMALIWINILLAAFLTPLIIMPTTWLMDAVIARRKQRSSATTR